MRKFLLSFLIITAPLLAQYRVTDRTGKKITIKVAHGVHDIDQVCGRDVLVRSFMAEYENVPLVDLNPKFKSIGDVRRFYEDYFDSELQHFANGELIWVQAFEGKKLLGWATFEMERDAAYMNLLVVDPKAQRRGVGEALTFAILSGELYPNLKEIRLLVRNVNTGGRIFYERLGFTGFEYERNDNFVDMSLLSPMHWEAH
ncbi:MAG: GNAT family N-acetyltransferase [Chlamydiales bacterium]|nr:GNAT family N-acetyltransferase [Chlamydiales bacterium]